SDVGCCFERVGRFTGSRRTHARRHLWAILAAAVIFVGGFAGPPASAGVNFWTYAGYPATNPNCDAQSLEAVEECWKGYIAMWGCPGVTGGRSPPTQDGYGNWTGVVWAQRLHQDVPNNGVLDCDGSPTDPFLLYVGLTDYCPKPATMDVETG